MVACPKWNKWMNERDQAPLDLILVQLHAKWEKTKDWLGDLCTDDESASTSPCAKNNSLGQHIDFLVARREVPANRQIVNLSGYEELDQFSSAPPSRPSTSVLLPEKTESLGATPVPQLAAPTSLRSRGAVPVHVEEVSSKPTRIALPADFGPSAAIMGQDAHAKVHKGQIVDVWSNSKQSWFEGSVLEELAVELEFAGGRVPIGSYKVRYGDTEKWIAPEDAQTMLRPGNNSPRGI
jgi:hypothetical protein